jgi:predicted DNA-binding protein
MAKTKYISTRLNDEQRESIEKYCETYGRSISHFIREAIDEKIEHFNRFENLLKPKK